MKKYIKGDKILYPYVFYGKYANGTYRLAKGNSEQECLEQLGNWQDKYGKLLSYSGINDENYVDGECVTCAFDPDVDDVYSQIYTKLSSEDSFIADDLFVSQVFDQTDYVTMPKQDLKYVVEVGRIIVDDVGAIYVEYYVYDDGTIEFNDSGCLVFIDGNGDWVELPKPVMRRVQNFLNKTYGKSVIEDTIRRSL